MSVYRGFTALLFVVSFALVSLCAWSAEDDAKEDAPPKPKSPSVKSDVEAEKEGVGAAGKEAEAEAEIVVTASRLPEPAKDVASSTTVVSRKELDQKQSRLVLDALRDVEALDVVQAGSSGTTSVFIRGANSEHTLVMIDGMEANDPISPGRTYDFASLTDDNIERIEVIRGPQSVLYGSDAMGGVINIITKKGQGKPQFNLRSEGGSFGTYRVGMNVSGGTEKVSYSAAASRFAMDGISSADEDNGHREEDGYQNNTATARVTVRPVDFVDINLYMHGFDTKTDLDNTTDDDDRNNIASHDQWMLKMEPVVRLFDGFWEQRLGVALTRINRENDNNTDPEHPADLIRSSFDAQIVDIDWQHNLYIRKDNTLTVGVETEEDSGESKFFSDGAFGPFASTFEEEKARTWGYYLQDRFKIGGFSGSAGVRLDDHEDFGEHVTYRFTGSYRFEESATRLRATLGSGFKAPTIFQLFSSFGDPSLEPEESLGWDIGVDQDFWSKKANLGLTFFHNDFENLIDFDSATSSYNNISEAKTFGIEFTAGVTPLENLDLRFNYTYLETEDASTSDNLLRRANHKFSFSANYRFLEKGNVNLSARYVGERDDNDFATFPATRVALDDYFLMNVAVSYQIHKHVEIFARGENLTNEDYEEVHGYGVKGIAGYGGVRIKF